MQLITWLMAAIGPLGKRLLIALGFSIVTFQGFDLAISSIVTHLNNVLGQTSSNVLQIATLFGVPQSMGIILGGVTTVAGISAYKKFKLL